MKPLIVANWKCNPALEEEAKNLFEDQIKELKGIENAEAVICPPFVYFSMVKDSPLAIGAQDCFWEQKGAYTGEISPAMLKDFGCKYVIIGHSERRTYLNESDEIINKKIKAAIAAKLNPILCVGETKEQRDKGQAKALLEKQITFALQGISEFDFGKIIIAYEPVWAIGTGNPCGVKEAQRMGVVIREILSKIYGAAISGNTQILYGGSVKGNNASGYIKEAGLQGLLVGGASLDAKEFAKIVKNAV